MRRTRCLILACAVLMVGTWADIGLAQQRRPVQLSLVTPIQIFPEEDTIVGLRLNLIYGRNAAIRGIDIGIANHTTGGRSVGAQFGLVGIVDGDFVGWQDNYVNIVKGKFEGLQSGLVNVSNEASGLQLAWVNHTQTASGLQLSIVNYARTLNGIQIGLINIIAEGGAFPVFPIVNWSFE